MVDVIKQTIQNHSDILIIVVWLKEKKNNKKKNNVLLFSFSKNTVGKFKG